MIKGYVDNLSLSSVNGWACNIEDPNEKCIIEIIQNDMLISSFVADTFRKDLTKISPDGKIAFSAKLNLDSIDNIKIIAKNSNKEICVLNIRDKINKRFGYQSFDNQIGDSDSYAKLAALHLPNSYKGLSILDIGCNEGFFCLDAIKRGASRVVGIDINEQVIKLARKRTNQCEYIVADWWNIPNEKFDIIYFLSAIHYERNQDLLLKNISEHLSDEGLLILECGIPICDKAQWILKDRGDGCFRYPSFSLMKNILDKYFYVIPIGKSVPQAGDPVPRFVFHCRKKRPVCFLVDVNNNIGKSNILPSILNQNSCCCFNIDSIFYSVKDKIIEAQKSKYKSIIDKIIFEFDNSVSCFYKKLDLNMKKMFIDLAMEIIPYEYNILILEGSIFSYDETIEYITKHLHARNFQTLNLI